jgi:hypothetical protein
VESAISCPLSEEAGAQIEAYGSHSDRNHQSETAKYGYQDERVRIGLGPCCLASENTCNDRIHVSLLIERDTNLFDRRCRSFSQGKKTASSAFPDGFVRNQLSAPR